MPTKSRNRAAVSNGSRLLPASSDGRSRFSRRYRDLVEDMASDLGGMDRLSVLQQQLVRRAAALAARCENAEADLAAGRTIDDERFASDVALLVRVARQLGLQRVARDVSGVIDLKAYIASKTSAPLSDEDDELGEFGKITISQEESVLPARTDSSAGAGEPAAPPAASTRKRSEAVDIRDLAQLATKENKTFAELLAERKA